MPVEHFSDSRSTEMNEVIGAIPPWIIRWGITAIFLVGVVGIFVSSLIQYPDVLTGSVTLQAKNQPGKVVIKRDEKDASQAFNYLVKDGSIVRPGDTLFIQTNTKTQISSPVITPMAGTIYITYGTEEQDMFEKVIWVVPPSTDATVRINYASNAAGNVKSGQVVKISLDEFPENEYGFLTGKVLSILPMEMDKGKQAIVALPKGQLMTSENKVIPVRPLMKGSGEILLANKSIFKRIFGSLVP